MTHILPPIKFSTLEFPLLEVCYKFEGLEIEDYKEDKTRKDKAPIIGNKRESFDNVPRLHSYLLSLGFNNQEKYTLEAVKDTLVSYLEETKNKDGIFIYNSNWSGVISRYTIVNPKMVPPTPFKELKHTSELLQVIQMFIADKWENFDKNPVNGDAAKWAASKGILISGHEAEAIDLITKPNKYKKNK